MFVFFKGHELHSAFRAVARLIGYYVGMHRAGVFLGRRSLLLARRAVAVRRRVLVMGVLRDPRMGHRQRHYTRD